MARTATITRATSESNIELSLDLDGTGATDIDTSVPFFNHMMTALGKHSLIDLLVRTATALPVVTALPVSALCLLQHSACCNTVLVAATLSVPL